MARHPDDNDKKPSPSQGLRPHKPGDRPKSGAARPGSASAAFTASEGKTTRGAQARPGAGTGRSYAADKGARPEKPIKGKRYSDDAKASPRSDRPGADKPGGKFAAKTPEEPKRSERIAKAMARAGIASRREVERLIGLGKVAVNGRILDTPATLVTRDDVITVDGKPIAAVQATRVWRYNKPVGLLTSHNDPGGRPTVFDSLPAGLPRVMSVGRLDINTEGLLLLTNDGELSRALELPATALVRQYRARARGRITQADLDTLKDGVTVDGERYGPVLATIDKAKTNEDGLQSANLWISVQISEGKNREVRKVLESIGLTVNRLIRLAYGPFQLGTLPVGAVEEVGPRVIRELLGEHIRPENLPEGNAVQTPAPVPGRRGGMPLVTGKSGSAISDPSRKPSRVRAAGTATAQATERANRPPKKAGWAKAGPKFEHPKKTFTPRARPDGEAPADDRPKRPFKPREDKIIGPKSSTWARDDKPARDGAKREFKPRTTGSGPARPSGRSGMKPGGGKPGGPRGPRSDG
ncbi:pseudouridine synthase [Brevundimonas sp.]|jgi:23S rRNA pseudouridine2605 synthase|uniref:pseudouridine synthase n=1 Tax=Brevundimonas sp. TaxID=1871086 RepID=UPI0037842662